MQKFAVRRAGAPNNDVILSMFFRLVKFANQCRKNMGSLEIVIIARAIEVCD